MEKCNDLEFEMYKTEQEAKKHVTALVLDKVDQGYQVHKHETDGMISIQWRAHNGEPWDYKNFEFQTIKRGDLFWCRDGEAEDFRIQVFTGEFDDTDPLFSEIKDLTYPETWLDYEPIGLNLFDKQELHND